MGSKPPPDPLFVLRGNAGAVNSVEFHIDPSSGELLLTSASGNGGIKVWSIATRRPKFEVSAHSSMGALCARSLGRSQIISQGRDGELRVWDYGQMGEGPVYSLPNACPNFCELALLHDDQEGDACLLAIPGSNGDDILVWSLRDKTRISTLPKNESKGMCMALTAAGRGSHKLCAGYEDGSLILWDLRMNAPLAETKAHKEPVLCVDADSSGDFLLSGSADPAVRLWTIGQEASNYNFTTCATAELKQAGIANVAFRHDTKIIATAGWDHRIRIFKRKGLQPLAVLKQHTDTVSAVCFSHPHSRFGTLLAAASRDERISVWSLYN
eukprot:Colp12_sorted_trinity150504_noHs@14186